MSWIRSLFHRDVLNKQLDTELAFHIEKATEARIAAGMTPDDARRQVQLEFGTTEQIKEQCRDVHRLHTIENFLSDARYAFRSLRKTPGFTCLAILILTLGIGANTAIFSVVNGILLRPLPFPDSDRLLTIGGPSIHQQVSLATLQKQSRTTDYAAYSMGSQVNLTGQGEPARQVASIVSSELFKILGVNPLLGGFFEQGRNATVILSYGLWQSRFQGDPNVIGRSVMIDDSPRQVVGVMPPSFRFPRAETQLWTPLRIDPRNAGTYWRLGNLTIVGRLRPSFHLFHADTELRTIIPQIKSTFPMQLWPNWGFDSPVLTMQESMVHDIRPRLLILLGAVGLVLLIACANFTNLLLVRTATRQKEISLRATLGATRARIVQQLLTESLILALAAGVLGLAPAWGGMSLLKASFPPDTPRLAEVGIDLRVFSFLALLSICTGMILGLLPALRASKLDLHQSLKASERSAGSLGRTSLLSAFVVVEVAVAFVVVIGAGLLTKSLWRLSSTNPGFGADHLLTLRVTPNSSLCKVQARCLAFYNDLLDRTRALPGVVSLAAADPLPFSGDAGGFAAEFEGHPYKQGTRAPMLWSSSVTPDYLRTMRIRLLDGRNFTTGDRKGSERVILLSALTAQRFWPGENPLGKHIRGVAVDAWHTVVGIVADTKVLSLGLDPAYIEGQAYLSAGQGLGDHTPINMTLVIRTVGDPLQFAPVVRTVIVELNRDVPVSQIRTMQEAIAVSISEPRSSMWLLLAFAALALLLGASGIYGVISYSVTQRIREIGVRMALGARPSNIRTLILGQCFLLGLVGLLIGLPTAMGLTQVLQKMLYEVSSTDTATYLTVTALVIAVTILAAYVPTRRGMRLDPAVALREE